MKWDAGFVVFHALVFGITNTVVVYLGIFQVEDFEISMASFSPCLRYQICIFQALMGLRLEQWRPRHLDVYMERLAPMGKESSDKESKKKEMVSLGEHSIIADDLSFSYELGGKPVFSNVNLEVPCGKYLLILGSSGVGKTTLLNCLMGIERPSSGRVTIGGVEIGDIDNYRGDVAAVTQNESPMTGILAARIFCVDEFIESFAMGCSTMIQDVGAQCWSGAVSIVGASTL